MNLYLIANIITWLCAFGSFIYGAVVFFRPKKAVYAQMITLFAACMSFGRLYQVVRLITVGDVLKHFQLGVVGVVGALLFLFSANFGVMDSLADDGSKAFMKYRLIPLAAPILITGLYAGLILPGDFLAFVKIVSGVICAVAACASYYNLKHLIFPDVDFGVIKCLKTYNFLALVFEFLCVAEVIANSRGNETAVLVIGILMGAVLIAVVPAVERGIKKWTT